jgi:hypothetical protein
MGQTKSTRRAGQSAAPSEAGSDTGEDQSTTSSKASSKDAGDLPVSLQKQLAEDVEAGGGIEFFQGLSSQRLSQLLNKDTDSYGERGQPIHRQLTNRVH